MPLTPLPGPGFAGVRPSISPISQLILVLLCCSGVWLPGRSEAAAPPPRAGLRFDAWGDPLPPGARARLGTGRFRVSQETPWLGYHPVENPLPCLLSPDGRTLAVGNHQTRPGVFLVDLRTNREIAHVPSPGGGRASRFSADGRYLIDPDGLGLIRIHDLVRSTQRELTVRAAKEGALLSLSPDGQTLAVREPLPSNAVLLVDFQTGRTMRTLHPFHSSWKQVIFSPDGRRLATVGWAKGMPANPSEGESQVQIWNPATGKEVCQLDTGISMVNGLAFSPDGLLLALARQDGNCQVWDLATRRRVRSWWSEQVAGNFEGLDIHHVVFSSDGQTVVVAGPEGRVGVHAWNVRTGKSVPLLPGPDCLILGSSRAEGRVLLWGISQRALVVWEPLSGRLVSPGEGHQGPVVALWASKDGQRLRSADGRQVIEWDSTGTPRRRFDVERRRDLDSALQVHLPSTVSLAVFSPDGRFLACSPIARGRVLVQDLHSARGRFHGPTSPLPHAPFPLVFSPDGGLLVVPGSGARTGVRLRCLDRGSGEEKDLLPGHQESVVLAAFHPSGRTVFLVSALESGVRLRAWDLERKREPFWFPARDLGITS